MLQIKNVNLNVGNTALLSNINLTLEQWSYVKKKYKLNTTNFLFLCNC